MVLVTRVHQPYSVIDSRYLNAPTFLNYTIIQSGPLTSLSGCEGVGYGSRPSTLTIPMTGRILSFILLAEILISDGGTSIDLFTIIMALQTLSGTPITKPLENKDSWHAIPFSRGTVCLVSTDLYAKSLIDAHYFSNIRDLDTNVEGSQSGSALSKTEAFQKVGTKFYDKIFPGCEGFTP